MRIGRNEPCPCGSGKKYKKCCMGAESGKPLISEGQLEKYREYSRKKAEKDPLKAEKFAIDMAQSALSHGLANFRPKNLQESVGLFLRRQAAQLHEDTSICLGLYFQHLASAYKSIGAGSQELAFAGSQELAVISRMDWWDRTLTRSFFTEVEGVLFLVQKVILWAVDRSEIEIDSEEEMRRNIGDGPFAPMLKTFKEVFSCFTRLGQGEIDYQDSGWAKFLLSHDYRNSFTHPKTTSDLALPPGFVEETLFRGMAWYRKQMNDLEIVKCNHDSCNRSLPEIKMAIMREKSTM